LEKLHLKQEKEIKKKLAFPKPEEIGYAILFRLNGA